MTGCTQRTHLVFLQFFQQFVDVVVLKEASGGAHQATNVIEF
jgi:folylpolyglutamate synthase/dihydropteroate synthase